MSVFSSLVKLAIVVCSLACENIEFLGICEKFQFLTHSLHVCMRRDFWYAPSVHMQFDKLLLAQNDHLFLNAGRRLLACSSDWSISTGTIL